MNFAARRTAGSAKALTTTSGPMPAASPIVTPMTICSEIELRKLPLSIVFRFVLFCTTPLSS